MFKYTTAGGTYKCYNAQDITEDIIANAIAGSKYHDTHYVYAKEKLHKKQKIDYLRRKQASGKKLTKREQHILENPDETYYKNISDICMGFDIEFTKVVDEQDCVVTDARSYMYHWQFAVNDLIITGRTWNEFDTFFDILATATKRELDNAMYTNGELSEEMQPEVIIWVANLPCEFQFIKDRIKSHKIFAKDKRKIVTDDMQTGAIAEHRKKGKKTYIKYTPVFRLQDCLAVTGGSLAQLAKDFTATKKLKGDLDYTITRNSQTVLTDKELHYCYNDVAILSEWHKYYYKTYIVQNYAPLTMTGLLRHEVKKLQTEQDLIDVQNMLPNYPEYEYAMNYLFKGGYAHANAFNTNIEIDNEVYSWDITSSYPYVMLCYNSYPLAQFNDDKNLETTFNQLSKNPVDLQDFIETLTDKVRFYATVEITCPVSKTQNTYISISKCINDKEIYMYSNAYADDNYPVTLLDNGRINRTARTITAETDLDILTILDMYDFAEIKFSNVKSCYKLGSLPGFLTEPIKNNYELKCKLKHAGKSGTTEYVLSKVKVNAGFGMTCAKLVLNNIDYDEIQRKWITKTTVDEQNGKTESAIMNEQLFLNPMWGIWVTSFARRRLMQVIIKAGDKSVVSDTDSIYSKKDDELVAYINKINEEVEAKNALIFNNNPVFLDLGTWDKQSVDKNGNHIAYERFATMGSKRYVLYGWNDGKYGWKQTIAGLPKPVLKKFCEKYNKCVDKMKKAKSNNNQRMIQYCDKYFDIIDPYQDYDRQKHIDVMQVFNNKDGFFIPKQFSQKTCVKYHDTDHSDYVTDKAGNTELMSEKSSMSVVDVDFSLKMSDKYLTVLEYIYSMTNNTATEKRLL